MHVDIKDYTRQAFVITKNEIKKFLAGKKIILFGILVLALEILNLVVPYIVGEPYDNSVDVASSLLGNINLFIVIAAILFTATSIVSEFEERTALVLFTKPIRKWSIFVGKLLASMIIMAGFILIIYLYTAIVCFATCGNLPGAFFTSLGLAICGAFGCSGLAILLSSLFKKGSTASIMTLVVYLLILSIVGSLISQYGHIDTWWMLNDAMGNITYCISGIPIIESYDPPLIVYQAVSSSDLIKSAGAMGVWGIVTAIAGFLFFNKRDF
ncbi:MAG: ABC transporter permease [Candidatus Methanomethylophilus sp.]|nr:ABC transporter permease [Methanomethylophilus sp.]